MYCTKCGTTIMNGERQCKQCGAELEGRGLAVLTARRVVPPPRPQTSRLAVWFLGLSAAGLACLLGAGVMVTLIERAPRGAATSWNLGLAGLALLAVGFLLDCMGLVLGALAALRLTQERGLKGRRLALAGAIAWLCGLAVFVYLRTDPHFRPPPAPLSAPAAEKQ